MFLKNSQHSIYLVTENYIRLESSPGKDEGDVQGRVDHAQVGAQRIAAAENAPKIIQGHFIGIVE